MAEKWITVKEASERSGLNAGSIRRMCPKYSDRGMAKLIMVEGNPVWMVNENADPRFMSVRLPSELPADLRTVSEKQRTEALRRLSILKHWEQFLRDHLAQGIFKEQAIRSFIDHNPHYAVSRDTLFRWDRRYRSEGLLGLVSKYAPRELTISEEAMAFFRGLYLTTNKLSVKSCYLMTRTQAAQNGWGWFASLRSCQRWVTTVMPDTHPEVVLKRCGEEAYNERCGPYLARDPQQFAGNECLVGDHHQLDLWCRYQGRLIRPWMTAWEDMRSKMITGWVLCESPNSSTILLAFRRSCKSEYGPPKRAYMDNGKDYDSFVLQGRTKPQRKREIGRGYINEGHIRGLFTQMGIDVTFAIPYNPQSKPIERFFRTLEDQFCKTFATYCGRSPEERPEDLPAILERFKTDPSNDVFPAFEEIEKKLTTWVDEVYHVSASNGNGMNGRSPLDVMHETQELKRVAKDEILDFLLMAWSKPVRVGKHGIRLNNMNYGMGQPEVLALQGQEVRLASDPADVSEVTVWSMDGRKICSARANGLVGGMTDENLRKGMAMKRHIKKALREADEVRHLAHKDVSELAIQSMVDAAKAEGGEIPPQNIKRYTPIRTELEAALMQQIRPMKKVSGDETTIDSSQLFDRLLDTSEPATDDSPKTALEKGLLKLTDE